MLVVEKKARFFCIVRVICVFKKYTEINKKCAIFAETSMAIKKCFKYVLHFKVYTF